MEEEENEEEEQEKQEREEQERDEEQEDGIRRRSNACSQYPPCHDFILQTLIVLHVVTYHLRQRIEQQAGQVGRGGRRARAAVAPAQPAKVRFGLTGASEPACQGLTIVHFSA